MPTKKYIDEHMLVHTLRIELMNGKVLHYNIPAYQKEELENWLHARKNDLMEFSNEFVSFYALPERMAFIRITAIKRMIFCWDPVATVADPLQYHDHFEVNSSIEEELPIPAVIVLLRSDPEALVFDEISPNSLYLGIDEESFVNEHFLKGGFISLPDEDGEENYIPVVNIDCLEVARAVIYPDDIWEDMENMRTQEDNNN